MVPVRTLRSGSSTTIEVEIKRSRFIATVARTNSALEARQLIDLARSTFPDARHHCSAYVVEADRVNPLQHFSDDGEPAGTAGKPMLDVLTHAELGNVTAVVTRYFGGTLLGTGGLVRAYSGAVQEAVAAASIVEVHTLARFRTELNPAVGGRIEAQLRDAGWQVLESVWGQTLRLDVAAPPEALARLNSELSAWLQSPSTFHQVGTIDCEVDSDAAEQ